MAEATKIVSFRYSGQTLAIRTNDGLFAGAAKGPASKITKANINRILYDGAVLIVSFGAAGEKSQPFTLNRVKEEEKEVPTGEAEPDEPDEIKVKEFTLDGNHLTVKTDDGTFATRVGPVWIAHVSVNAITQIDQKGDTLVMTFFFEEDEVVSTFRLKLQRQKEIVSLTPLRTMKFKNDLSGTNAICVGGGSWENMMKFVVMYQICGYKTPGQVKEYLNIVNDSINRFEVQKIQQLLAGRPTIRELEYCLDRYCINGAFSLQWFKQKVPSDYHDWNWSNWIDFDKIDAKNEYKSDAYDNVQQYLDQALRRPFVRDLICMIYSYVSYQGFDPIFSGFINQNFAQAWLSRLDTTTFRMYKITKFKENEDLKNVGDVASIRNSDDIDIEFRTSELGRSQFRVRKTWLLFHSVDCKK